MRVETDLILNGSELFSTPARLTATPEAPQDVMVIHLTGPLTRGERVDFFLGEVRELVGRGALNLLIDLAHVPYVDSGGIGGLAAAYNVARDSLGHIKFLAPSWRVLEGLRSLHLDRVFELFDNEPEALASFRPTPRRRRTVGAPLAYP